jgi:integrase
MPRLGIAGDDSEAGRTVATAESEHQHGCWCASEIGQETFGEYANRWYEAQDLAASTMQNLRRHIERHLLPAFEDKALADIQRTDVDLWEKRERADYAASSVSTWRATLHVIFEDAVFEGLITINPAARRRGRGRRAGRSRYRGPEKVVTDALGILLTAERAALLSGRDDEFVAVVLKGYTGMRWGEIVGLETEFARPGSVRVEWQLYELDTGALVRCPPKDDSYRTIDSMDWL